MVGSQPSNNGLGRGVTSGFLYFEDSPFYYDSMREYFPHFMGLHELNSWSDSSSDMTDVYVDFKVTNMFNDKNHRYFVIDELFINRDIHDNLLLKAASKVEKPEDVERIGNVKWTIDSLALVTVLIIAHDLKYVYSSFFNEKTITATQIKQILLKDGFSPYVDRAFVYLKQLKTVERSVDFRTYQELLKLIK